MRKFSTNQLLQVFLILALIVNAIIHFSSPSYRYYRENFETVKKGVVDFENRVKLEFIPAILNIATNRVLVVSNSVSSSFVSSSVLLSSDTNTNSRLMSLDFHWFRYGNSPAFELDGVYYFSGDVLFGSVIRSITPTMIVTDDYQFVKPLMGKFSLDSSVTVSSRPTSPPLGTNTSVVVPYNPDSCFAHPASGGL